MIKSQLLSSSFLIPSLPQDRQRKCFQQPRHRLLRALLSVHELCIPELFPPQTDKYSDLLVEETKKTGNCEPCKNCDANFKKIISMETTEFLSFSKRSKESRKTLKEVVLGKLDKLTTTAIYDDE